MKQQLITLASVLALASPLIHAEDLAGRSEQAAVRTQPVDAVTRAAAERLAVHTCAICHGVQGRSVSPKFPVLAGQHADYVVAQLRAFKSQSRADPDALGFMWGMAAPLDDGMMTALADYYSRQSPAAGASEDRARIARGRELYLNGDNARGIAPCAACHGPLAAGSPAYPRLAGQHASYLMKQMRSFQDNLRSADSMRAAMNGLTGSDMEAVAGYLQSLGPETSIDMASARRAAM